MLWTWVFASKNNLYFARIRRAGCSFLSWRDKEEMTTLGVFIWYELLFFWTSAVNLDFFSPSLSISFPMDLILLPFMLMLPQWSSLISKEFLHIYNLFHPEAVGIRREATYWRWQMLNVSNPFSNEIVERHEWGQKASFPVPCVWRKESAVRRKCERNGLYICVPLYWGLTGNTWGLIQEKVNSIPL